MAAPQPDQPHATGCSKRCLSTTPLKVTVSTPPITSISSTAASYANAFSADDLQPVQPRGYNPAQGLPTSSLPLERPGFSAEKTPQVLPPRPQNSGIASPYNPATDVFETSAFKIGDVGVSARYNNGGLLTQPSDRGTQTLAPAGAAVNPSRVDLTVPVVRDAVFSLDVKARLDSGQGYRVGPEIGLNLGDLKVTGGIYESQPIQSVLQNDGRARTEVGGAANLKVTDSLSVGVGVSRTTGGGVGQSGTTGITPSVALTVGGTQIQAGATFTLDDRRGNTEVGALLTVQPSKPDNTRPYGFAVVKYGDNPLTDGSASFSVNGGLRF